MSTGKKRRPTGKTPRGERGKKKKTGKTPRSERGSKKGKGTGKQRVAKKGRGTGKQRVSPGASANSGPSAAVVGAIVVAVVALLGTSLWIASSGGKKPVEETVAEKKDPNPPPPPQKTKTEHKTGRRLESAVRKPKPEKTEAKTEPKTEPKPVKTGNKATVRIKGETRVVSLKRLIDGDTFHINEKIQVGRKQVWKIRLLGLNTPEGKNPRRGIYKPRPYYQEAKDCLKELLGDGQNITIEFDGRPSTGSYGRVLAYVHKDGVFINGELVRRGFAYAFIWPNTKAHKAKLIEYQRQARKNGLGLWSLPQPESRGDFLGKRRPAYYHREGCKHLRKRRKGYLRFKSREEALDMGLCPCSECKS